MFIYNGCVVFTEPLIVGMKNYFVPQAMTYIINVMYVRCMTNYNQSDFYSCANEARSSKKANYICFHRYTFDEQGHNKPTSSEAKPSPRVA